MTAAAQLDDRAARHRAHLRAELDWLRALLAEQIGRVAPDGDDVGRAFLGFTVGEAAVDAALTGDIGDAPADWHGERVQAARQAADELAVSLAAAGDLSGLDRVTHGFGLGPAERAVLLLAAAPALDDRFETTCA